MRAKNIAKLENVSARFLKSLPHPSKGEGLTGVRFSSDSRRLIAGSYPGGVIRLWDVATTKPLTTLETGNRRSTEYFFLTPDWKSAFVPQESRDPERIEKNGKSTLRFKYKGEVQAWDLETGKLRDRYTHSPPRGILAMALAADGKTFLTSEQMSGEARENRAATSLWDVASKKFRPLARDLEAYGCFAPDSKSFAVVATDQDGYSTSVRLTDVDSLKTRATVTIKDKWTIALVHAFSPDGFLMVGTCQVFAKRTNWENSRVFLKIWDTTSGAEVASLPSDKGGHWSVFSQDGKTLAAVDHLADQTKVYLVDVAGKKLRHAITLDEKLGQPFFSPDGRWAAVITQNMPSRQGDRELTPDEIPQARIHLVDLAAAAVRETLVSPRGFVSSGCFSPDGKLLATGADGEVVLWDVADLAKESKMK